MFIDGYEIREDLLYDASYYWVRMEGQVATIGLTAYGQETMGDVLFLETARPGDKVRCRDEVGSIESGKWVGKMMIPVSGTIIEINHGLLHQLDLLNSDPYGEGWIMKIEMENTDEGQNLMSPEQYGKWLEEEIEKEKREELII